MKNKNLPGIPEEIQKILLEMKERELEEYREIKKEVQRKYKSDWDYTIKDEILFFDPNCSYEITGYRPINKELGLDFDPSWFVETRDVYKRTGNYTQFRPGTKAYNEFWQEQYHRCRDGYTVNGYTITGDHYFFLNFYQLMSVNKTSKATEGRLVDFPNFLVTQYEYLHYVEICKRLRKNIAMMKARGQGFSELNASILANLYSTRRNSVGIIAAYDSKKLAPTTDKIWSALTFLNDHTNGGFFKLRQVKDSQDIKRASYYKIINGQKVEAGWMSEIINLVADNPSKLRGYRCELLIYEEAGSWPDLQKAVILGQALTGIMGNQFGIQLYGGTSGDSGAALEGIRNIFYNPESYNVLPYKHNYTQTGETILSGFFLPAQKCILDPEANLIDSRGYTDPTEGEKYYMNIRSKLTGNARQLLIYSAEYPLNTEEMFSLEGLNKFDQTIIAEQLTRIRALKEGPKSDFGTFRIQYKDVNNHEFKNGNVTDIVWQNILNGKIQILEHPLWILLTKIVEDENGNKTEVKTDVIPKLNNLYVAGIDSIDLGLEDTSTQTRDASKFCMVIYRRAYGLKSPQFVAMYTERPDRLKDAFKTAMCLAMYYNCQINLEATRVTLLSWARSNNFMQYFMHRPKITYPDSSKRRANTYGTPATSAIIDHLNDLIADYVSDYGENIWFEEMLMLLNRYSVEDKRKFDIIASMGMALLADEELSGIVPRAVQEETHNDFEDIGFYYDENGIKHWGRIPKNNKFKTNFNNNFNTSDYAYGLVKTSNPRNYF